MFDQQIGQITRTLANSSSLTI